MRISDIFYNHFNRNRSYITGVLVFLFSFALPLHARADDVTTIAVPKPSGPKAGIIQKNLKRALEAKDYNVVLAEDPDATATLTATTHKVKKRWRLDLVLTNSDGETLGETTFKARKPGALGKTAKKLLWKRLGSEIEEAVQTASTAQDEQEEQPDEEPAEQAEEQPDTAEKTVEKGRPKKAEVDAPGPKGLISITPQAFRRSFDYAGDAGGVLAVYDVPAVLALAFDASYYPLPNYGAAASFSYAPSFDTTIDGVTSESFPTTATTFMLGARARYPVSRFLTHIDLDFGGRAFTIKDSTGPRPEIPNVKYRYLRLGAGGSTPVKPGIEVGMHLGYRHVLSSGEVESQAWFPKLGANALDLTLSLVVNVMPSWDVVATGSMERYSLGLNTETGDARIASSATDMYILGTVGLQYEYSPASK